MGQRAVSSFVTHSFGRVLLYADQLCAVGAIYSVVHQRTPYPPFFTPDYGSPLIRSLPHDIYDHRYGCDRTSWCTHAVVVQMGFLCFRCSDAPLCRVSLYAHTLLGTNVVRGTAFPSYSADCGRACSKRTRVYTAAALSTSSSSGCCTRSAGPSPRVRT